MEVVALVSGGKDSCFAMMRCLDYGHKASFTHPQTNPPPPPLASFVS
jgi:diphthamide synthase (EF-2-diphthine--ammonia ligase)